MLRALRLAVLLVVAMLILVIPGTWVGAAEDATPAADCPDTTPEQNANLVRTYWAEVVKGEQGQIRALLTPDQVQHWGLGGDTVGIDAFIERFALRLAAFPDLTFAVDLVVAQGDLVASRFTATGTQTGVWQGVAATDREVIFRGNNVFRIACGRIAEAWGEADHLGVLEQIDALDLPPEGVLPAGDEALRAEVATPCTDDSPAANVAVARRWMEEVLGGHHLGALEAILAPGIVYRADLFPDAEGAGAVKEALDDLLTAFPDLRVSVDLTVAQGDLVAMRWSADGTQRGPIFGVAPTEKAVTFNGTTIYRVACGRISEAWSEADGVGLLRQINDVPPLATPGAVG